MYKIIKNFLNSVDISLQSLYIKAVLRKEHKDLHK